MHTFFLASVYIKEFSCINAVQHRAGRVFMGVGKYTPNAVVNGDLGWEPHVIRQCKAVMRLLPVYQHDQYAAKQTWFSLVVQEPSAIHKYIHRQRKYFDY